MNKLLTKLGKNPRRKISEVSEEVSECIFEDIYLSDLMRRRIVELLDRTHGVFIGGYGSSAIWPNVVWPKNDTYGKL